MKAEIADLAARFKAKTLTNNEVIKVLKGIGRREEMKTNAAFFGYDIRLYRLQKSPGDLEELKATQQFLALAFETF